MMAPAGTPTGTPPDAYQPAAPPVAAEQRHKSKTIAVFNFKGGAAKTTLVANLGGALAHAGKKTLLVDFDSQCNLTSLFEDSDNVPVSDADADKMSQAKHRFKREQEMAKLRGQQVEPSVPQDSVDFGKVDPTLMASFRKRANSDDQKDNVHAILKPVLLRRRANDTEDIVKNPSKAPNLIRQVNANTDGMPDMLHNNLWILEGHGDLQQFDAGFSEAVADARRANTPGQASSWTTVGACYFMLQALAERGKFDFILVDMSPSQSAMNRCMAMSCDFIIPPCFPDSFSAKSVAGLLEKVRSEKPGWT